MIACLRVPYFTAEALRRAYGLETGVPLVALGGDGRKVTACDAQAAEQGVAPGLTRAQAAWYCPAARFVMADEAALQQAERAALDVCADFTPRVECAPGAQAHAFYLDFERLAVAEIERLGVMLLARLEGALGLAGQIGLAAGKFPAYALAAGAEPGTVRHVPECAVRDTLAALPLDLLPLGKGMRRRLGLFGIGTLGAFAALPGSAVLAQFGKVGAALHKLAQGIDSRPVVPFVPAAVATTRATLEHGLNDRWALEQLLSQMVNRLVRRLRELGSMGRTLHLVVRLEGGRTLRARQTLRRAASGRAVLQQSAVRLLNRLDVQAPVIGLELTVADLLPFAGQQLPLLPDPTPPRERLQARIEALLARPDAPTCVYYALRDPDAGRLECRYQAERAAS